ncbi:NAD(P)-binding domain-containing protein [Nocardioides sp.]|uniref:flavin-containing monooxygenase n=1 Tax=Nocardioides sp. TaxID=35761 RepID=UPI002606C477|nr:NAD(P)-binding domain-containing protein [Nocardioides sp.]
MNQNVAIIGAGPSGLAAARSLDKHGITWTGFELADDVGGLWDITHPRSTVYQSAHLISSKTTTQFAEFPMADDVADYPSHRELRRYFHAYADRFDLRRRIRFGTEVTAVTHDPATGAWTVTWTTRDGESHREQFTAVIAANGTLSAPNIPAFAGQETFTGQILHTSVYKDPRIFTDQRVLIVGAGNSGCDIAVDAVHHAASVDLSVRRGYHFVPKYLFGKPADTLNNGKPLPARIKQAIDSRVLKAFTGDPARFGFPKPDHKLYESHPIVNSLILHHLGHGDARVVADIERFDGETVRFKDGTSAAYDMVVLATGYRLHYPFLDKALLNWTGAAPDLYLNIVAPTPGLFVVGMIEASGIGWQGRAEQAELVATYLDPHTDPARREQFDRRAAGPRPDLSGGYRYLGLDRMAYYVNKDAYRTTVRSEIAALAGLESNR